MLVRGSRIDLRPSVVFGFALGVINLSSFGGYTIEVNRILLR